MADGNVVFGPWKDRRPRGGELAAMPREDHRVLASDGHLRIRSTAPASPLGNASACAPGAFTLAAVERSRLAEAAQVLASGTWLQAIVARYLRRVADRWDGPC